MRAVVLVEGRSDQAALHALAELLDVDLHAASVQIRPIGGATNIRRALADLVGPPRTPGEARTDGALRRREGPYVGGMCDVGEERYYSRAVAAYDGAAHLSRQELEAAGFFVCEQDLEDELLSALGTTGMMEVLERTGDLQAFHTFTRQPAQRDRDVTAQLHRFLGTQGGRKIAYAAELVRALGPDRTPRPLRLALAAALTPGATSASAFGR
ncbi:ATP-dependent endonuclease [Ruania alkalisoli]|uniref:ATP-dependent endonuclease n=1 Tax=Ruania alkalisoli TaxID=2779775 RepID=A0A7M1SRP9_9MICO|nr:TOPRIM nucleotidyl transferase/hydrolase domain-containing protein [Ruania alkalisoli]QOR70250.1 ATP-dependent endonuclease [Ruania alkalisoli]